MKGGRTSRTALDERVGEQLDIAVDLLLERVVDRERDLEKPAPSVTRTRASDEDDLLLGRGRGQRGQACETERKRRGRRTLLSAPPRIAATDR